MGRLAFSARRFCFFAFLAAFAFTGSGCAKNKDLEKISREQAATIQSLSNEIKRLNDELDQALRAREELARAKEALEDKLRSEIGSGDFALSMQARGLVLTVQDKVLFDSGKNELKGSAKAALYKISKILNEKVGQNQVNIEGHTDNVPIRASNWKSNWELSTGRATEVIHFFVDEGGMNPERFAAVGFGEFHPIASNNDPVGRRMNRRVDIVISPLKIDAKKN